MDLTPKQQASELIKKANNILLISGFNNNDSGASLCLAASLFLEKMAKKNLILKEEYQGGLSFLPKAEKILKKLPESNDFIISLSLENDEVDKVSYEVKDNHLKFYITSKNGNFSEKDIFFSKSQIDFDLIITIGTASLEKLGNFYDKNSEFFYQRPIINIDNHSQNSYFGTVNYVDLTASSVAEILVSLFDSLGSQFMDPDIATCLLTGLILDTNSFQNSKTTPKSLTTSAQLIAAGARHSEIVKNVFKSKSFEILKLWGKILSKIETDDKHKILWSEISPEEAEIASLDASIVNGVLDELLSSVANINIYLLFVERTDGLKVFVRTKEGFEAKKIAFLFGGQAALNRGSFSLKGQNLTDLKKEIIKKIADYSYQIGLIKGIES